MTMKGNTREPDTRWKVSVCDECLTSSCLQGYFMCIDHRAAGVIVLPVSTLDSVHREDEHNYANVQFQEES